MEDESLFVEAKLKIEKKTGLMLSMIEIWGLKQIVNYLNENVETGYRPDSLSCIDSLEEEAEALFLYEFYDLWPGNLNVIDKLLNLDSNDNM